MKHILKLSIPLFLALLFSPAPSASMIVVRSPKLSSEYSPLTTHHSPFEGMTIKEFLNLTPGKYKELTGKRLSLSQKISLKLVQYRVKKMVKKNKQVEWMLLPKDIDTNNFDILGFVLGIALGPIGILIAYLIEGVNSSMFRWALYGGIIWLGIFLLVVLIL